MINTQGDFPESRYRHCHNVGKKMQQYARDVLHKDEEYCSAMFILGCMHDVGYELDGDAFKHDEVMCEALGQDGYRYATEIRYHSFMQDTYNSVEMRLLYFGDMTVDGMGNWCTLDERLEDIAERHGKDSTVYKESKQIADQLIEWGFDDSLNHVQYANSVTARPGTVAIVSKTGNSLKDKLQSRVVQSAHNDFKENNIVDDKSK